VEYQTKTYAQSLRILKSHCAFPIGIFATMSVPPLKMRLSLLFQKAHGVWPPLVSHSRNSLSLHASWWSNDQNFILSTNITEKSISQETLIDIPTLSSEFLVKAMPPTPTVDPSPTGNLLVMIALSLAIFLVSLDTVVITTALPTIAHQFGLTNSGYAWIGSAYLLTNAAFVPFWGRISDIFGRKPTLLVASFFFLAGSIISALAPNGAALISGRAVQGFGGGGMGVLVNIVISDIFDMRYIHYSLEAPMLWRGCFDQAQLDFSNLL
jgi:hypothetical protein